MWDNCICKYNLYKGKTWEMEGAYIFREALKLRVFLGWENGKLKICEFSPS